MYWLQSFFVVGARKPEQQVQQVYELIAPADHLSSCPFFLICPFSSPHHELETQQQEEQQK
jgi:hypothetical protein